MKNTFGKWFAIMLCFVLMISFSGCGKQIQSSDTDTSTEANIDTNTNTDISTDIDTDTEINTNTNTDINTETNTNIYTGSEYAELYSFIIPESLFGGGTAEEVMEELTNPDNSFLLKSGEEVPVCEMISDIKINDDGTLTYFLTADQLERYRIFLYETSSLQGYIDSHANTSIISTEFADDTLTSIVVYVDKSKYDTYEDDGIIANFYSSTYMGTYQIVNGTDPYEWHVHVTVKDYETGKILTEAFYPIDR